MIKFLSILWLELLLLFVLLMVTACSTPNYSANAVPVPVKGKPLEFYNLGWSNAVKRQYWIARAMQQEKRRSEAMPYQTRYYTFNIQPDPAANIARVPYNVTLPILE